MPDWTSCWNGMGGWGMGFGGGLFMLIFWAVLIVGLVLVVRWAMDQSRSTGGSKSALDILRERYARGEIQKDEYEEKKRELIA